MRRDKSGTREISDTVEELCLPIEGTHMFIDTAEVTCTVEHEEYDPGDEWSPPNGGGSQVVEIKITHVDVSDIHGNAVKLDEQTQKHCRMLADKHLRLIGWMDDRDEWATESYNEIEQGEYEYAMEQEAARKREPRLEHDEGFLAFP